METTYTTLLALVVLFSIPHTYCNVGTPAIFVPGVEGLTTNSKKAEPSFMGPLHQTEPGQTPFTKQQILHKAHMPQIPVLLNSENLENSTLTFNNVLEALNEVAEQKEHSNARTTFHDYEPYLPYPRTPYGYQSRAPNYGYGSYSSSPAPYYESSAYIPPKPVHAESKLSLLKPDLSDLLKPVTMKGASKFSSLIGLGLALLSGSPDGLELKGLKDLIINGILKPLLIAKGGIKSLISKLTIPLISLLLINIEFLITAWWLWDDCPKPIVHPSNYVYPNNYVSPKPYNYNYNSYR